MFRIRLTAALALCLTGGVLSLMLLSKHYGIPLLGEAALAACGEGGGCDAVSQSRWASVAGVPLAAVGLFFYGALLALLAPVLFAGKDDESGAPAVGFHLAVLAVGIDLALLGLQAFSIQAFCKFCIATYFVNGLIAAALWPFRQSVRARGFLVLPTERRAFVAWVAAVLAVAASALATNAALVDRKALAGASILGLPSALEAPVAAPASPLEEQLAAAQAEAKKWKATLDDEKRLQVYLNEKAKSDFNETAPTKLDLTHAPAQGVSDAPIVVASFSDFMCPFCRDLSIGLRNFLPTAGNRVRSYYKHFPLDMACNPRVGRTVHEGACDLALAGVCAEESGRFWDFHDRVFARTWDKVTREDVLTLGAAAGLDRAKLSSCMSSATTRGRLNLDIEEGWRLGVASTPTLFVNGKKLKSPNVFLLAVEEERKRLNLPPLGPFPRR